MAAVPRIGPPRAGTVVAADLGPSLAAYRDHLDLQVISDAPLPAALAAAWGKPALAGCRCVLMGADPADPSTHWLRLLEVPGAVAPAPMRQRGWLALEVLVRDVVALGRRLEGGPFRILGAPRPLSVSDDIWAMQVAGPAGETLYLTEVRAPVPPFELPMNARFTAERLFIPVLSAPRRDDALAWYAERAGAEPGSGFRFESRVSALSRALGLDPEHRRAVATLGLAGRSIIEIDEVPEHPAPAAVAEGLPAGLAMVSLHAATVPAGPTLEAGPAGEWIEWLPPLSAPL